MPWVIPYRCGHADRILGTNRVGTSLLSRACVVFESGRRCPLDAQHPPTRLNSLYFCGNFAKAVTADQPTVVRYILTAEWQAARAAPPAVGQTDGPKLGKAELVAITNLPIQGCAKEGAQVSVSRVVAKLYSAAGLDDE